MRLRWNTVFTLAALLMGRAAWATAQCRPADPNGAGFVRMIQLYTSGGDRWDEARDSLRISPPDPRTGVVLIAKAATCKSANTAYQKEATGNRATLSGQVYVVQSGSTYIV